MSNTKKKGSFEIYAIWDYRFYCSSIIKFRYKKSGGGSSGENK
jgi:hypothetical protein